MSFIFIIFASFVPRFSNSLLSTTPSLIIYFFISFFHRIFPQITSEFSHKFWGGIFIKKLCTFVDDLLFFFHNSRDTRIYTIAHRSSVKQRGFHFFILPSSDFGSSIERSYCCYVRETRDSRNELVIGKRKSSPMWLLPCPSWPSHLHLLFWLAVTMPILFATECTRMCVSDDV